MSKANHISLGPAINLYENFLPNPEDYIQLAEGYDEWHDGNIQSLGSDYRIAKIFNAFDPPKDIEVWQRLQNKVSELGKVYSSEYVMLDSKMQLPQLIRYEPGHGFYAWHCDADHSEGGNREYTSRVFSLVLYLNDVAEGGETEFRHFDLKVAPKAGSALVFPANYAYAHRSNAPQSNAKYILVTWFEARR
jgi:hypothetical protein